MATATAIPEVFTRKASGLVRVMSPYSAFVYNILTMGLIFPWTYLWAPGALPGGKLVWGILLAMLIEIPIAFAYVWLSTALPRSGGDYVFQSRVFGGGIGLHRGDVRLRDLDPAVGRPVRLAALLPGLRAALPGARGHAGKPRRCPTSASGSHRRRASSSSASSMPSLALVILCAGFKNYVRLQWVMWYVVLLAFGIMFAVLVLHPAGAVRRTAERLRRRVRWRRQLLPDGRRRRRCRRDRP